MRRKTTEFIGNNIKYFIIAPLLTIAESSTELLLPFLMGRIVDDGLNAENSRNVLYIGLWMIGISLLGLLLGIFSARTSAKASQGYGFNLRQAMFRQIQTFSFADIDTFSYQRASGVRPIRLSQMCVSPRLKREMMSVS